MVWIVACCSDNNLPEGTGAQDCPKCPRGQGEKDGKEIRVCFYGPHLEKTGFLPVQNKGADQLRSNCEADQCLCFCYI